MTDLIITAFAFFVGWFFGYKYSLKIGDLLSKKLVIFGKEIDTYFFFTNFKYLIAGLMMFSIFFYKKEDLSFVIMFSIGIFLAIFIVAAQVGFLIKTIFQGLEDD